MAAVLGVLAGILFVSALIAANVELRTNQSVPGLAETILGEPLPDLNGFFPDPTSWSCGSLLNRPSFDTSSVVERVPVCDAQLGQQALLVGALVSSGLLTLGVLYWVRRSSRVAATVVPSEVEVKPAEPHGREDSSADVLSQIERLASLRERGIVSEAEYDQKKAELLRRL